MTEVPIIKKPVFDLLYKSMDWFLYDRDPRHERIKVTVFNPNDLTYWDHCYKPTKIKVMDWFLYDSDLLHERVKVTVVNPNDLPYWDHFYKPTKVIFVGIF